MRNTSAVANERRTEEIQPDRWITFLDEFTRRNRGAHARLEIIGADADTGVQFETENRPFEGISADIKDRERAVWIVFGGTADDRIAHGVQQAAAIRVLPATEASGDVLEVEGRDGTKTILELDKIGEFALPPRPAQ